MSPHAAVALGAALLDEVLPGTHAADAVVAGFWRRHPALGLRERAALADAVFAVLRHRRLLEHMAQHGPESMSLRLLALVLSPPPECAALLTGGRAASHWTQGLSGPMQAWLGQRAPTHVRALPFAVRHSLPDDLAQALRAEVPEGEHEAMAAALLAPAPLDLRVNLLQTRREAVRTRLATDGVQTLPTPYSPWGLRVQGKPSLKRLAAWREGWFEVQDEGSQLIALLTGARRGETVADFCAGAGGKTLALGAMMRNTGQIYALDTSAGRLHALAPRLARSGLQSVLTMALAHLGDQRLKRLEGRMDRVLVDAPCSGLGTLRRSPELKWRAHDWASIATTQMDILRAAARLVRPGGRLVYATCSLLSAENEAVAQAFDPDAQGWIPLDAVTLLRAAGVDGAGGLCAGGEGGGRFLRLWPHRHGCDGFFAAAWQRR